MDDPSSNNSDGKADLVAETDEPPGSVRIEIRLSNPEITNLLDRISIRKILKTLRDKERLELLPLFQSLDAKTTAEIFERAAKFDKEFVASQLQNWKSFPCPPGVNPYELAESLRELEEVETAYVTRPGPPPAFHPSDDPLNSKQKYLDPAPSGIDVRFAREYHAGFGQGIDYIDIEQGWNTAHEDLCGAQIETIFGKSRKYMDHGTRVLGVISMQDNDVGGVGIAPKARGRLVSQWRTDNDFSTADAIFFALSKLDEGDVLLLEVQEYDPKSTSYYWPAEITDANYLMLRMAAALGIVVIEAAGNGNKDLDAYRNLDGKAIFDRNSDDFRDSGAILVGAATSSLPHQRLNLGGFSTNYGNRIDCYAWGEKVATTNTDPSGTTSTYKGHFGFTSAAAAIIAGAAVVVQGLAVSSISRRLTPHEMVKVLNEGGTESEDSQTDRIGVMPNLRAIIESGILNTL